MHGVNRGWSWGLVAIVATVLSPGTTSAHDRTRSTFLQSRRVALAKAAAVAEPGPREGDDQPMTRLTLRLTSDDGTPMPGLARVTNLETGKAVQLHGPIARDMNWYVLSAPQEIALPRTRVRIDAIQGLETESASAELDLTSRDAAELTLAMPHFYDAHGRGLQAGNTHLHLMDLGFEEAFRYLQVVPRADALDLVYVSYLSRTPEDRNYITNQMVTGSLMGGGSLARLSQGGTLFAVGEEHRHNFGPGGQGYGHVMFLDILDLIQPVSIGPGIMKHGTDAPPLRPGIRQARQQGGRVIWCHGHLGFEDVPNWVAGLVDAQNIFDGTPLGSYEEAMYRYLDLGLKVPFSTGTDWGIYDFSRVYVPVEGKLTSRKWLESLAAGRSVITNGPLLELEAGGQPIGGTISLDSPGAIEIRAKGLGRVNFSRLELVYNGRVVHAEEARPVAGHFEVELHDSLLVSEPGWLAVRIPRDAGVNEFDKPLYAHTSPICIEYQGRRRFRPEVAQELIAEMRHSIEAITAQGTFADDGERESVLAVYREAMGLLEQRLSEAR